MDVTDNDLVHVDLAARVLRRSSKTIRIAIEESALVPDRDGRPKLYRLGRLRQAVDERLKRTADQTRNDRAFAPSTTLTQARAEWVQHKAAIALLERRKREGQLVELADVKDMWESISFTIRAKCWLCQIRSRPGLGWPRRGSTSWASGSLRWKRRMRSCERS